MRENLLVQSFGRDVIEAVRKVALGGKDGALGNIRDEISIPWRLMVAGTSFEQERTQCPVDSI